MMDSITLSPGAPGSLRNVAAAGHWVAPHGAAAIGAGTTGGARFVLAAAFGQAGLPGRGAAESAAACALAAAFLAHVLAALAALVPGLGVVAGRHGEEGGG
jgi:hypothetical protein